jgi:CheY-like chemotaxis protein
MTGPRRVMVVDDDDDVRALSESLLRNVGHEVEGAADGVEAIRKIEARRPDLIVLDLLMPRVDGWGVLEFLEEHPDPPPVILLTSEADFEAFSRGLKAGIAGYIPKPLHFHELVATCERVLNGGDVATLPAERRAEDRRPIVVAVAVTRPSDPMVRLGRLVDVSFGGAQVELDVPLVAGERVKVAIRLSEFPPPLALDSTVVWRRTGKSGYTHGVSFGKRSKDDERRLRALLTRRAPAMAAFAVE